MLIPEEEESMYLEIFIFIYSIYTTDMYMLILCMLEYRDPSFEKFGNLLSIVLVLLFNFFLLWGDISMMYDI